MNTDINTNDDKGMPIIRELMTQIKQKQQSGQIIPVAFIDDPGCDKHRHVKPDHQESPHRTSIIRKAIEKYKLDEFMIKSGSITLTKQDMYAVHDKEYIELLITNGKLNRPIRFNDSDDLSMLNIDSLESIFAAAASVLGAVDTVCGKFMVDMRDTRYMSKRIRKVFCNVRPPAHHAHADHGAGFCFMNNVAIGAKFAFDKYNSFIKKILIFDWDLHHGDGTEDIFKDDPNVMYVS